MEAAEAEEQASSGWSGLAKLALLKYGAIGITCAFMGYAWYDIKEAHAKQNERMITMLEARAKSDTELAIALGRLASTIEKIAADAHSAHKL